MSEEHGELQPNLDANEVDHFVAAVQASLGGVPGIGPIVAGLVTSVIPRQRLDRVADMVRILNDRVSDLEQDFVRERMLTPEFVDLLEESFRQAATSAFVRREYIAALLKNSIMSDDLAHEEEKTLLSLLGELNDPELIFLGWYGSGREHIGQKSKYYSRHEDVLRSPHISGLASDEDVREAALKEAYRDKLRRLGLASPSMRGRDQITELGRLLLRQIDFYSPEGTE
jgi:hypothetical protein